MIIVMIITTLKIVRMHLPGMEAGVTVSQLKTYRAIQEIAAKSNDRSSGLRSMIRRVVRTERKDIRSLKSAINRIKRYDNTVMK